MPQDVLLLNQICQARYEILEEDRVVFGEIPGIPGVWATGTTKELCEKELYETLQDWIQMNLEKGIPLPAPQKEISKI